MCSLEIVASCFRLASIQLSDSTLKTRMIWLERQGDVYSGLRITALYCFAVQMSVVCAVYSQHILFSSPKLPMTSRDYLTVRWYLIRARMCRIIFSTSILLLNDNLRVYFVIHQLRFSIPRQYSTSNSLFTLSSWVEELQWVSLDQSSFASPLCSSFHWWWMKLGYTKPTVFHFSKLPMRRLKSLVSA